VQTAESRLNRDIADLNNYFILTVPEGADAQAWLDRLNALPEVEIALAMPLPAPAPLPPNYQGSQGYLGQLRGDRRIGSLDSPRGNRSAHGGRPGGRL